MPIRNPSASHSDGGRQPEASVSRLAGMSAGQQRLLLAAIAARASLSDLIADSTFWQTGEREGSDTATLRAAMTTHASDGGTLESFVPFWYAAAIDGAVASTLFVGAGSDRDADLEIDEVVHAAQLKVWQVMLQIRDGSMPLRAEGSNLQGYVVRIAVNSTRDLLRRVRLKSRHHVSLEGLTAGYDDPDTDPLETELAGSSPSAEDEALRRELHEELCALIGEDNYRLLLFMAAVNGSPGTGARLARQMGREWRRGLTKAQAYRVRAQLRSEAWARQFREDWRSGIGV